MERTLLLPLYLDRLLIEGTLNIMHAIETVLKTQVGRSDDPNLLLLSSSVFISEVVGLLHLLRFCTVQIVVPV